MKKLINLLIVVVFFGSCVENKQNKENDVESIKEKDIVEHISILASDEFQGRAPGTKGEELTIDYLEKAFRKRGLKAMNKDSYFQDVPLAAITTNSDIFCEIKGRKERIELEYAKDIVVNSPLPVPFTSVKKSKLVFWGFGIVAPEYKWNDYKKADLKGKTVVLLTHDPGFYDQTRFKGETMTKYGRDWHKYRTAAKHGADGVIIIHIDNIVGYKWNPDYYLPVKPKYIINENLEDNSLLFEARINQETAVKMLNKLGFDFNDLQTKALSDDFVPVNLNADINIAFKNVVKKFHSKNALAVVEGSSLADEYIVITAHWDHLGIGKEINGDSIYNGAADDAVGIAGALEIADAFGKLEKKQKRSIALLFTTAEERGLLGSTYYSHHPLLPVEKTVANFNIDGLFPMGKMKDVGVIGYGLSELDNYLEEEAAKENRTVTPDNHYREGYFYRLDMYNFARLGVPAHHIGTGSIPVDSVKNADIVKKMGRFYHQPTDEYRPDVWDMSSIVDDLRLTYKIAKRLSNENTFPKWNEGVEFERNK